MASSERFVERSGAPVVLWIALVVPPLAVLADLELGYGLAPRACADGSAAELLAVSALAVLVAAAAGVVAWRVGMRAPREEPHAAATLRGGHAFLAVSGLVLAASSCLLSLAMALVRVFARCG
jgi:hypothetical protein